MSARTHFAIADDVMEVLKQATITDCSLKLNGQLDRKLYVSVNKVLEAAGGSWDRGTQSHRFEKDPRTVLGLAMETGKVANEKTIKQAFYTPDAVAAELVAFAEPRDGMVVLEPSAGHGALADQCIRQGRLVHDDIECIELDPDACAVLRKKGYHVTECDFLSVKPSAIYDLVVMNPPFTRNQDIAHVLHAIKFLRPGGQLVAIMSPGWQTGAANAHARFRTLLFEELQGEVRDIEKGAFKESGTNIATVMIRLCTKNLTAVPVSRALPASPVATVVKPGSLKARLLQRG